MKPTAHGCMKWLPVWLRKAKSRKLSRGANFWKKRIFRRITWNLFAIFYQAQAGSDEKLFLFCGLSDLTGAGGIHGVPDENEDIHLHCFTAEDVFAELLSGSFNNAAALICLQWLQMNRERLRKIHAPE